MNFFAILLLAVVALSGAAQECGEQRAENCVETLLSSLLGDTTEEEVCTELRSSIDCLRSAADECLEEQTDEVEEGLKELEDLVRQNCAAQEPENQDNDEEDNKMELCVNSNEDYFYQCVYEGSTQAFSTLLELGDVNENELKCSMYSFMAECFVERMRERCGEEAGRLAKEEFEDAPSEIKEACEELTLHSLQLLESSETK